MKQTRFGKKVQNWHRPLAPGALKQRFRRLRHEAPGVARSGTNPLLWDWSDDCDTDHEGGWWPEEYEWNITRFQYARLVEEVWIPRPRLAGLDTSQFGGMESDNPLSAARPGRLQLEERLAEHAGRLLNFRGDPELISHVRDAFGHRRNREFIEAVRAKCPVPPDRALREPRARPTDGPLDAAWHHSLLGLFAPFWVREPRTWDPASGVSLAEHVLTLYPVPRFLFHTLADDARTDGRRFDRRSVKWMVWLLLLGQGGSLKTAAEVFDWDLPTRFPAFLLQAPPDVRGGEACVWAEVLRLGGDETDARRMLSDRSYVLDVTDWDVPDAEVGFWRDTARWMIAHRNEVEDERIPAVLAWARHRFTETRRRDRARRFSWKGRSPAAVVESSLAYAREVERREAVYAALGTTGWYPPHLSWPPHGWDWVPTDEAQAGWSVVELTTVAELIEEGRALRHCVGGYGPYCATGLSAILSVRFEGERRVTLEVDPASGRLIQVRGAGNRLPEPEEQAVISAWRATACRMP